MTRRMPPVCAYGTCTRPPLGGLDHCAKHAGRVQVHAERRRRAPAPATAVQLPLLQHRRPVRS